jgi:hypothetical protein
LEGAKSGAHPEPVEGSANQFVAGAETSAEEVDASFARMSKRFHDRGGEIYVPASD